MLGSHPGESNKKKPTASAVAIMTFHDEQDRNDGLGIARHHDIGDT